MNTPSSAYYAIALSMLVGCIVLYVVSGYGIVGAAVGVGLILAPELMKILRQ